MRINSKGQVTIPAAMRRLAGLPPGTHVEVLFDGASVQIQRTKPTPKPGDGERLVQHLRKHGANLAVTADEVMAPSRDED
jgi:AbrB family looped-hinge helix DNA binding protein